MRFLFLFAAILISNIGCTQNNTKKASHDNIHVGGSCEGCEAIHESPIPFDSLKNLCRLPDWNDKGKKLAINGVVYKADGTPAPNVIIYVYHTDQTGIYPKKENVSARGFPPSPRVPGQQSRYPLKTLIRGVLQC